jgi:hypothetical protein
MIFLSQVVGCKNIDAICLALIMTEELSDSRAKLKRTKEAASRSIMIRSGRILHSC